MKSFNGITNGEADKCIEEFTGIIYRVMKELNLPIKTSDGDEFIQIGYITLLHAYIAFGEDPFEGQARFRFIAYAKTRIRWKFMDVLRKKTKVSSKEVFLDDSRENVENESYLYDFSDIERILSLKPSLTEGEWVYVKAVAFEGLTPTELAKREGVHRQTIYKRRDRVANKIKEIVAGWE